MTENIAPVRRDVVRYGAAVVLGVAFGVVQMFVVPRRLALATYGEYRLFLVYAGYVGILHLGLADGAFLRWAGQPIGVVRHEWRRVLAWVVALDGALLVAALMAAAVFARPLTGIYLVGIAACALATNAASLTGYALQAVGDFKGAGRVAVAGQIVFSVAVVVLPLHTLSDMLVLYVACATLAAVVGMARLSTLARSGAATPHPTTPLVLRGVAGGGLPVVGANLAAGLAQTVDRLLVSMVVPATTFALYGFASTINAAITAATQALVRVALSHAARHSPETRAAFLARFEDVIAAGFGVGLAGVPLFAWLVQHIVPQYVTALPIVYALVVGAPFWMSLNVVFVALLQSHGYVRAQLVLELVALAVAGILCGGALWLHLPLWQIAAISSVAGAGVWIGAIIGTRRLVPSANVRASKRFGLVVAAQIAAAALAVIYCDGAVARTVVYALLGALPTAIAVRAARGTTH